MRRRRVLAALGAGTVGLSGCLGGDSAPDDGEQDGDGSTNPDGDDPSGGDGSGGDDGSGSDDGESGDDTRDGEDRRYRECSREVIPYEQFPPDLQAEIDAALDGEYAADRVYLVEAMDFAGSYVSVDGAFYDPEFRIEGDQELLNLRRVDPKALPDPRPVSVEHDREDEQTITVELVAGDGDVLLYATRQIRAGGEVEFGTVRRVGTHDLRVTVADGGTVTDEWERTVRIDQSRFSVLLQIADDLRVGGAVAELGECRFEADETQAV